MAAGDLSPDAVAYRRILVAGTGLRTDVATAWIGAESGWGTTKPGHNYLNIGPGRTYDDARAGANAAVRLISSSPNYAGIRASRGRNASAQLDAIAQSPWDAGRYGWTGPGRSRLHDTWRSLGSAGATPVISVPGIPDFQMPPGDPDVNDAVRGPANPLADLLGVTGVGADATVVGLTLLFAVTGLALIALGIVRATRATSLPVPPS